MLTLTLALLLSQSQPAVKRTTPATDDPGMVVRQVGTVNVNCTSGCSGSGGSVSFDGGNIGYMRMPDGGPLEVYTVNSSGGGSSYVNALIDGGWSTVTVINPYFNVVVDGGAVVDTQGLSIDGGREWATDLARVRGNPTDVGSGASSTGTQRVILATDQPVIPISDNAGSITVDGTVAATQSGTWNITNVSGTVSLPTGAATAANQTTLGNQTTKLNDGTDTAQVSAGGALLVDGSATTQPVSGTVTANAGTGNFTVVQSTASNLNATVVQSTASNLRSQTSSESNTGSAAPTQGSLSMGNTTTAAPTYTNNTANALSLTTAGALRTDSSATTQPVSGTVSAAQSGTWNITNVSGTVSLPTGAATETTLGTRLADATFTGRFNAAAALADATANPTVTSVGSYLFGYNGTTWDRLRSSTSNGLLVDISRIAAGTNYIGKVRQTDGTLDLSLLNSAPGSDTGQVSVPVRIISSLAGGAGGTSSSYGSAFPASGTAAGFSDGTNMQGARVFDADTGAGSQYVLGANLRVSASGGSSEAAAGAGTTSASTLRVVLPTDQTVIPVSDNGGSLTVDGTVAVSSVGGTVTVSGSVTADTELPAAAALADATANPTTTSVGALGLMYNGTTWDRFRGDTTNGLLVNVSDSFLLDATFTGRFSAGAAATDNFANPTTTGVLAFNMVWDGATWDRLPGTSAAGLTSNTAFINGTATASGNGTTTAGTQRVTLSSDSTGQVTLATGANVIGSLTANQSVNLAQVGGTSTVTGGVAGSQGIGGLSASGAAKSGNPVQVGGVFNTTQPTVTTGQTVEAQSTARGGLIVATGVDTFTATVTQSTASNLRTQTSAEGATGSAVPANAIQMGASDGTNLRAPRVYDVDTGGGAQYALGSAILAPNSGGATLVTSANTDNGSVGLAVYPISKFVQSSSPTTTAVTCATTATLAPTTIRTNRVTMTVFNNSSVTIYLGGSTVTTSNGLPLLPGASFTDNVEDTPYYCRVASGTADLRVMEN